MSRLIFSFPESPLFTFFSHFWVVFFKKLQKQTKFSSKTPYSNSVAVTWHVPTRRGMCELQKKTNIKPASSFDNFKSNNPRFWHILKLNVILVAKLRKKLTFCGTKNLTTPILLLIYEIFLNVQRNNNISLKYTEMIF